MLRSVKQDTYRLPETRWYVSSLHAPLDYPQGPCSCTLSLDSLAAFSHIMPPPRHLSRSEDASDSRSR